MVLVLETLYTDGNGTVTNGLSSRPAKVLGSGSSFERRQEYFKRFKNIYDSRCDVVHGRKLIEDMDEQDKALVKDAFKLTRESLRTFLTRQDLFETFSEPSKRDERVQDYFRKIDQGGI